jgi:hypothetical protein
MNEVGMFRRNALLACWLFLCSTACGAAYESICQAAFHACPEIKLVQGRFELVSIQNSQERFFRFQPDCYQLRYLPESKTPGPSEAIEILGKRFPVSPSDDVRQSGFFALDIPETTVWAIALSGRKFLCLSGSGIGLYRSGAFERFRFMHVFDVTHTNQISHYRLAGALAGAHSLGDLSGSCSLAFALLKPDDDGLHAQIQFVSVTNPATMITDAKGRPYYINLLTEGREGFRVLDKSLP